MLFLVIILASIFYLYFIIKQLVTPANSSKQKIKSQWLLGIGLTALGKPYHEAIAAFERKYGDVFSFKVGFRRVIIVSRVDYAEHILSHRQIYDISDLTTRNFSLLFPGGLLALKGENWKRHAHLMLPVFRRAKILPHFENIVHLIDDFIQKKFVENNNKIHKDLVEECQHTLLNVIARIAFNYDFSTMSTDENRVIHEAFNDMVISAGRFALMVAIPLWVAKVMLYFNRRFQRALSVMKHYVMLIIQNELTREKSEFESENKKKSLIESLVDSSKTDGKYSLTSGEMFDEISMSILAGFETTSTALSWFFFYMSKYPDVQQKLKDELRENNVTSDKMLTPEILDKLLYVDCFTKELLRFAPIAAGIIRQAVSDDIINETEIKKGDLILIAIQNLHKNPAYWNIDPTKFVPERFLNEDKNPPRYSYMPFGGGHRACIGQDLAVLELKIAIVRLMQRITIEDPGLDDNNSGGFSQLITCYPKHMAVRVIVDP